MTKPECATAFVGLFSLGHLDFVILSSFVIGHSSLISINRLRPSMQLPLATLPNGKLTIATNLLFASLTKRVTDP